MVVVLHGFALPSLSNAACLIFCCALAVILVVFS
jgi:hypothetical protein